MENETTHINENGDKYYSRLNEKQEREYSFTIDFEDIWTDAEEQWVDKIEEYIKPAIIKTQHGQSIEIDAKTVKAAKQKASKWAQFGSGTITLEFGSEIYQREFWQNANIFGWHGWKQISN